MTVMPYDDPFEYVRAHLPRNLPAQMILDLESQHKTCKKIRERSRFQHLCHTVDGEFSLKCEETFKDIKMRPNILRCLLYSGLFPDKIISRSHYNTYLFRLILVGGSWSKCAQMFITMKIIDLRDLPFNGGGDMKALETHLQSIDGSMISNYFEAANQIQSYSPCKLDFVVFAPEHQSRKIYALAKKKQLIGFSKSTELVLVSSDSKTKTETETETEKKTKIESSPGKKIVPDDFLEGICGSTEGNEFLEMESDPNESFDDLNNFEESEDWKCNPTVHPVQDFSEDNFEE
jgi:hypothetical protein